MVGSAAGGAVKVEGSKLKGPTLIGGTWDLKQFEKNGKTDWDAVIDAGETVDIILIASFTIRLELNLFIILVSMGSFLQVTV